MVNDSDKELGLKHLYRIQDEARAAGDKDKENLVTWLLNFTEDFDRLSDSALTMAVEADEAATLFRRLWPEASKGSIAHTMFKRRLDRLQDMAQGLLDPEQREWSVNEKWKYTHWSARILADALPAR